jgi:hypothetical protein
VGLPVLHHDAVGPVHHGPDEGDPPPLQVDVAPPQPAHLAAPSARGGRQPEVGPELEVALGRGVEEPAQVGRRRRAHLTGRVSRRRRQRGRVPTEQAPLHALLEARVEDGVDPGHRGGRQGRAVPPPSPVQLGVEPVDVHGRHPAQRDGAPAGPEVVLDDARRLAESARRPLGAEHLDPRVVELADGAARPALVPVLDLDDQPVESGLRLALGAFEGPADVLALPGEGIATGVGDQLPSWIRAGEGGLPLGTPTGK